MIVTQQDILMGLGTDQNSLSAQDMALLNFLMPLADRLVKKFVKINVEQASWSEYLPDRGLYQPLDQLIEGYEGQSGRAVPIERFRSDNRLIQLRQLPIRTVTLVYESPGAWDTSVEGVAQWTNGTLLREGSDWQIDDYNFQVCWSGFLFRRTGVWTQVERAIRVDYTAGLTNAELSGNADQSTLSHIAILNPGTGYVFPPPVTITGGGGQGATAQAYVANDGGLSGIAITNAGKGYTAPPLITIPQQNGGVVAVGQAFLSNGNLNFSEFKMAAVTATIAAFNRFKFMSPSPLSGSAPGVVVSEGIAGLTQSLAAEDQTQAYGLMTELPMACKAMLRDYIRYSAFI